MIIYRLTDRIPVKIGELTFWVSPLSYEQKVNLQECRKMEGGQEVVDHGARARLAIKYGVKEIQGIECADGSPYQPKMDSDGTLSMEAVDELSALNSLKELVMVCMSVAARGVPDSEIPGVEVDLKGVKNAEKKD